MELKRKLRIIVIRSESAFESHLYGIETRLRRYLQYLSLQFESHLYGIETLHVADPESGEMLFESHLYGIETITLFVNF